MAVQRFRSAHCGRCGATLAGADGQLCAACVLERSLQAEGPDLPATPRRLGSYELIEEIARGGMGVVYRARQMSLGREVALKIITGGAFASADSVRRFRAEAELAARLDHPNIVPIFEIGEHDAHPFFSMGLVRGPTLTALLERGPLEPRRAAQLAQTLAGAIHFAHQRGILHRDVKPGNILMDQDGEPRLTDFGLARLLETESTLTHTHAILGTPAYMAPEQARGDASGLSMATDIYALGAVLYECLTGAPPFAGGTSLETVRKVLDQEPRCPRALNPRIDADLATICLKCLEKSPSDRYPSAAALAEDLENWKTHRPVRARPSSATERARKLVRRHPLGATLLAALFLTVAAGAGGVLWQWRRAEREWRSARVAQERAEREHYFSALAAAQTFLEEGAIERARETLLSTPPALRHWVWGRLMRLATPSVRLAGPALPASLPEVVFSPQGDRVATLHGGVARVWSVSGSLLAVFPGTGYQQVLFSHDGLNLLALTGERVMTLRVSPLSELLQIDPAEPPARMSLSPDGSLLSLLTTNGAVEFWNVHARKRLRHLPGPFQTAARFSPAGDRFTLFTRGGPSIWNSRSLEEEPVLSDLPPGQRAVDRAGATVATLLTNGDIVISALEPAGVPVAPLRLAPPRDPLVSFALSGDGSRLYGIDARGWFSLWNARDGSLLELWPQQTYLLAESPGARVLALYAGERFARLRDLESGREFRRPQVAAGFFKPVFSPDDRLVAFPFPDGTVEIFSADPRRAVLEADYHPAIRSSPRRIQKLAWSPDGTRIAAAHQNNTATVWDVAGREQIQTLHGHRQWVLAIEYSPDGRLIATGGGDRTVRLWDSASGAERTVLRGARGAVNALAWSPDSRSVVAGMQDGQVILWNPLAGVPEKQTRLSPPCRAVAWSPDGRWIAASSSSNVVLLDPHSLEARDGFAISGVWALRFDPASGLLAASAQDGSILLWELAGRRAQRILNARAPAYVLDFSPDSRLLAAGCSERQTGLGHPSVTLWNVAEGRLACEFPGESGQIPAVRFSPDGRTLAVGHTRGYVELWETTPWAAHDPLAAALARSQRELTAPLTQRAIESPARWEPPRQLWPERSHSAHAAQVDLTPFYNGELDIAWPPVVLREELAADLSALPRGLREFGGVTFDVRGVVQLASRNPAFEELYPHTVTNIPLPELCAAISILHGAVGYPGSKPDLGEYRLRYTNGQFASVPIELGRNVTLSWRSSSRDDENVPEARLVWRQWSDAATPDHFTRAPGAWARLYLFTWRNPHPEWRVAALEAHGAGASAAPFIVAITTQPLQ